MCWAATTVWNAVLASPQGSSDQKLGDTLYHIHLVQHIFLQSWTGAAFNVRHRTEFAALVDVMSWGRDAHHGVVAFMQGVDTDALEQPFRMPWAAHFEERSKQPAGMHTL